jgi:hypothetical protein
MGLFDKERIIPSFASRSEAFDFMLAERLGKGDDYSEAADKADKFADIIAKNKKLPATPPKPKNGIEAAVGYIEQIVSVKREHPEVWELVVGGIGGLISGFSLLTNKGSKEEALPVPVDIDFENLE